MILGGDSNLPVDQVIDKATPNKSMVKHVPKNSKQAKLIRNYDLIDAWQENNLSTRGYTYYSHVHGTYSQIDHFFIGASLVLYVTSGKILATLWSKHSPVQSYLSDL